MKKIVLLFAFIIIVFSMLTVSSFAQNEYVFDANYLSQNIGDKSLWFLKTNLVEDNSFLRITTSQVNSTPSNTYVRFDFFGENDTPLFDVDEYPFVAISYKTNIAMDASMIHINAGMKINGSYLRCWGLYKSGVTDGTRNILVYDVREFSGTYENTGEDYKYKDVDSAAGIRFIRIPPWAKALSTSRSDVSDDYFDIEYIGFFQSYADANLYFDNSEYTITYYDKSGNVYHSEKKKAYTLYEPIVGPEVEGLVFSGWKNSSGTKVPDSFRIDTDYEFYPTYTRTLDYYVYTAGLIKTNTTKMDRQNTLISENHTNWLRFVVPENGVHDNGNAITFNFSDYIPAKEYKYLAIKYKSNISTATKSATSPSLKYQDKYYRFWGLYPAFVGDGKEQLMIASFDSVNGGDASAVTSFAQIDENSSVQNVRFTPWGQPNTSIKIKAGEYIDIAYIGFFKSREDALAFSETEGDLIDHKKFMEFDSELKFRPDDNLTRGEASNIITRIIADYNKIAYLYTSDYTDITTNDECYSSVAYLELVGYLSANGGEFKPDEDIKISDLITLINKVKTDKYITGEIDNLLPDGEYITRSDAAELFCKLLSRNPSAAGISNSVTAGPIDVPREHKQYAYIIEACYNHKYMDYWDDSELWTYTDENDFYMKKAPEGVIEQLNNALAERAENILETESEWSVASGGKVFYVSNKGNDSNDGLSASKPIATIAKIHQMQTDNIINAGDVVLFERGGEWYPTETLNDKGEVVQDKFNIKAGVTVSAYGEGDKPRIIGSLDASDASSWTKVDGYADLYVFNKKIGDAFDVGNIVFNDGTFVWEGNQPVYTNGSAFGMRLIFDPYSDHALQPGHNDGPNGDFVVSNGPVKWSFNTGDYTFTKSTDLQAIADAIPESDLWYHHNKQESKLYLICKQGNPGEVFDRIDLCTKGNAVRARSDVTIDNICVKFTGSHGIGAGSCENLVVRNCEVGWIGGSIQANELDGETGRFGNAIEVYGKADGFYVYNCFVYQCFDCGPTVQVGKDTLTWGDPVIQKDVHFYGNALWNAALEVWLSISQENFGKYYSALINCKMYDNLVAFNGYGFQGYTHQKHNYCGFYGAGTTQADYIDCYMENNTFWNLRMNILKATPTSVNNGNGIYWRNNTIIHEYDYLLGLLGSNTKDANGSSATYYYNNETIKKLISDGALGYNNFYYTLKDVSADPVKNYSGLSVDVIPGDANGDGKATPEDLVIYSRYLARWDGYEDLIYGINSDLDNNRELNSLDIIYLARKLANWVGYSD